MIRMNFTLMAIGDSVFCSKSYFCSAAICIQWIRVWNALSPNRVHEWVRASGAQILTLILVICGYIDATTTTIRGKGAATRWEKEAKPLDLVIWPNSQVDECARVMCKDPAVGDIIDTSSAVSLKKPADVMST